MHKTHTASVANHTDKSHESLPVITTKRITPTMWPEVFAINIADDQRALVPWPHVIMKNYVFDRKSDKPNFDVFAVLFEQKVVGLYSLGLMDDNYLWFGGFQVDKAYQHKGIGKAIFKQVMSLVKNHECYAGIKLDVHCNNRVIMLFYQRLGWSLMDRIENKGKPCWVMTMSREKILASPLIQ